MTRRRWIVALVAALLIIVAVGVLIAITGPGRLMGLFHKPVAATPAPTAIPLPSSTPTTEPTSTRPSATPAAEPIGTALHASPSPATEASPTEALTVALTPTQVVPPAQPVDLPAGFGISVYQRGLRDPRMMTIGPDGRLYVAERGAGAHRAPTRPGRGWCGRCC